MARLNNKNRSFTPCLLAAGVMMAVSGLWSSATLAAVGRTPGHFEVSPSGAASYSIPIFTPPGPRGVQPSIALVYDSRAGIGPVGRGWSIAGLQSIARCDRTAAQDANAASVKLMADDGYCLNGNRLRLTSGTYGATGSTYQTEIADFSLVTVTASAVSGPTSFAVKTRDGLTVEYGNTSDSRITTSTGVTHTWMANLISDRWSNRIRFTYTTMGVATAVPSKIEWTATGYGASTFVNEMTFSYGTNVPESTPKGYIAGTEFRNDALLNAISVSVSGTVERKYFLQYGLSPTTGAKRLTSVEECPDASHADCLAPTTVAYQDGQSGTGAVPQSTLGSAVSSLITDHDFNADGIEDILYKDGTTWYVALGSTSGLGSAISTGLTGEAVPGDVLGTGKDVILAVNSGTWYAYTWNGSSFSSTSTGVTVAGSAANVALADANGDGKDDLVYVASIAAHEMTMAVRPNTSSGTSLSFGSPVPSASDLFQGSPYAAQIMGARVVPPTAAIASPRSYDFDGDSRKDVIVDVAAALCHPAYGCVAAQMRGGMVASDGFQYWFGLGLGEAADGAPMPYYYVLNANNDQCTDFVYSALYLSKCNGVEMTSVSSSSSPVGPIDWDGDGRMDLLTKPSGSSTFKVAISTGSGFAPEIETGFTAPWCKILRVDTDGDGLDDMMCWLPGGVMTVYAHSSASVAADLATSFVDGFSVGHVVSYKAATWGNHTPQTDATYPNLNYQGPLQIVAAVQSSDGVGGNFTQTYQYYGAALDVTGRGFVGFASRKVIDSRSNAPYIIDYYSREFPYAGMLTKTEVYQSNGTLISRRNVSLTQMVLDSTSGNQRTFVYSSGVDSSTYEVGGSLNGQLITQTSESRTLDSWGNVTASTSVVTDKDTTSPHYNHSWTQSFSASIAPDTGSNWCLGLPTATAVTYSSTVSGETSVTRSKSYTPDYANCRPTAEVTEPSGGNRRVDVAYSYDSFGNVSSVSVTGRDAGGSAMSTRTSYMGWGTTGQFPISETNALGEVTTRVYDTAYGELATETDPNGIIVITNQRDSFGRVSRATRADGTSTVYTYADCSSYGCENGEPGGSPTGIDKMIVIASERDTSDTQIRDTWTHLDRLGRTIVTNSRLLSGAYNRVGRQYDAFGRVYRETAPCEQSSCSTYWVTNTYDALGRLTQQSRPQSQSVSAPVTTTFGYAGRTQTVTDSQGKVTTKILDAKGQVRRSQDHDGYYQSFGYDAFGSLKVVNDSLSNTLFTASYSYGIEAFQDASTDMDLGTRAYSRNSLGELTGWTDAKSQNFGLSYDALSRPTSRSEAEGTTTWTWGTSAGSYNIGRLASVSMSGYSENLTYDSKGRTSGRSITTDQSYVIDYAYNSEGQIDTLTWPTSTASTRVKVKYGYQYGILKSVTDYTSGSAGTVYWQATAQNARGQITQETLGNGVVTGRAFDAVTGQVASIQSGVGGGAALQNESYLHDLVGNVTQRQEGNLGLTENFYYDNLYRLSTSALNGTTNLAVNYDAMGNITSRSDVASNAAWTYHPNKRHAVTRAGSNSFQYTYDANGNMITRKGLVIVWTSYNYPSSLASGSETAAFLYGPERQYIRQTLSTSTSSETTHYIGGILEKMVKGTVTDYRHYVQVNGQIVAVVSRKSSGTNAVRYMLEDNQGSAAVLVSSSGGSIVRESFGAFGLSRNGATWSGAVPSASRTSINGISRRGYTGHSMLGNMGLTHMNGRVQDAVTGRFLSPDPYVQDPAFTQSFNRYAYVTNSPLSYIDASGFQFCWYDYDWTSQQAWDPTIGGPGLTAVRTWIERCSNLGGAGESDDGGSYDGNRGGGTGIPGTTGGQEKNKKSKDGMPQGHDYRTTNQVCERELTTAEQRDLLQRFAVPSIFAINDKNTNGEYLVTNSLGIPGGFVQTSFSPDGLRATNVTTPYHAFVGTIVRTPANVNGAGYISTHGFGDAGGGQIGRFRDWNNQEFGPGIFNYLDRMARAYASYNYPGC